VYRWDGGPALVQTVDFFTPVVDDPFHYGQIAAANAVSDIYAMGGEPRTALAIAGFPSALDRDQVRAIFLGGLAKLREAGVALLGGHTVQDREVKFGYAVTGEVDPDRILTNAAALPGDVLFLTKPIGTGVIATATKFGRVPQHVSDAALRSMLALNRDAARAIRSLRREAVHACTDVTGFGLIGHASELAAASGVTVRIDVNAVPLLEGALDLAAVNKSGGLGTNQQHFGPAVALESDVDEALLLLLYDPQTSGGLLVSAAAGHAGEVEAALSAAGVAASRIGLVLSQRPGTNLLLSSESFTA
jgi:selenide, water dikinase